MYGLYKGLWRYRRDGKGSRQAIAQNVRTTDVRPYAEHI